MRKKNATVWEVRFKNKTSSLFQDVGSSIEVDKRLYKEDIRGSIAHTNMLGKQKIISQKRSKKIIMGLKKINKEIQANKFNFKKNMKIFI